jgi:hypothetical protein
MSFFDIYGFEQSEAHLLDGFEFTGRIVHCGQEKRDSFMVLDGKSSHTWSSELPRGTVRAEIRKVEKPAPPRTGECWLNVYADNNGIIRSTGPYCSRALADNQATCLIYPKRIACIRVELVEGRFDS